jgi:ubiquinone/menaquinone biosynthesis C-methylase UbiE
MAHRAGYVPAAGHDLLLPFYDPLLRLVMREKAFRTRLLEQAEIGPRDRVLDLGCGTGTLLLMVQALRPQAELVGVDGDPKVLGRAHAKAAKVGAAIRFDEALADRLPYPDARFDRVLSSLMLHHLSPDEKRAALREVRRVLAPGGSFHLLDFGPPANAYARLAAHLFDHGGRLRENLEGRLPERMREAGLAAVRERGNHNTPFGPLAFYSAAAPGA